MSDICEHETFKDICPVCYGTDTITRLTAEVERLKGQLPEGMQHRKIIFEECPVGHGNLRGENWIKHECEYCKVLSLTAENERLRAALEDEIALSTTWDKLKKAEAEVERMRAALRRIADFPAWGAPNRWEQTPFEVRQLARETLEPKTKPAFTTGHCAHMKAPGGCQLHNLHCGYPECDRRAALENKP